MSINSKDSKLKKKKKTVRGKGSNTEKLMIKTTKVLKKKEC